MAYVLALDEGTTTARAIVFDRMAMEVASETAPIHSHYPHNGWVEQDAEHIWPSARSARRRQLRARPWCPRR